MITQSHRQEDLSVAYIRVIAALAGVNWAERAHDYGIDITLREVGSIQRPDGLRFVETGLSLDVQAKCTTKAARKPDAVTYALEVKNYNDLCMKAFMPRILVLVVLDGDEKTWLIQTEDTLAIRASACWLSLEGQPEVTGKGKDDRVTVSIPRANQFTPDTVRQIIQGEARKRRWK